ncbi:eIF2 kinase IF2K-C [Toxoplasma gondii TgCatPRC2]|uniref:EIF2 kinase IF2K-C n=10 Tax=Toxoplasma gondii TaxID=5811 RepID=A0A125YPY4_TOXGV|nr:eIF2 kinase IF2K-C [Toxoplasma gondii GT1]ESS33169.1 eIF2 kinase IF2K-C [Toxoplasma gondii VEG]KFG38033.1 eIF2 kinase IF2K-C [Toxoplasma gondii GAB2-2007-GAL-DOM2]KFG39504.1 eIF2 kinase IF2K-C [Toxoplasma gondii FOU]KFG46321.1 eIF2 kinase IF2K-C [Toxoplasma gondii p89]KFG61783.1 eIF2 kinase IF2K-C [Toxoplasma gondii RUB]KFH07290.1 eIF2 kinase IF2K-C [Toxoplasma gondii VAND]KYK66407.1 eIF2 kinase IF2K-C [Toxoplasma gondii TgCatPRC2]PIL99551.1 eIF2 kinase IF2K-C [Toxoplasma gondii COUG]RQ
MADILLAWWWPLAAFWIFHVQKLNYEEADEQQYTWVFRSHCSCSCSQGSSVPLLADLFVRVVPPPRAWGLRLGFLIRHFHLFQLIVYMQALYCFLLHLDSVLFPTSMPASSPTREQPPDTPRLVLHEMHAESLVSSPSRGDAPTTEH